jgi:hypothetical protein
MSSASEWAPVGAAAFSALAAGAAWANVVSSARRDKRARSPHLSGGYLKRTDPNKPDSLMFINAGPGLAIAAMYLIVDGNHKRGGTIGRGFLAANEREEIPLSFKSTVKHPTFICVCRGIDGNGYIWRSTDDKVIKEAPGEAPTLGKAFQLVFPDVQLPGSPDPDG